MCVGDLEGFVDVHPVAAVRAHPVHLGGVQAKPLARPATAYYRTRCAVYIHPVSVLNDRAQYATTGVRIARAKVWNTK